MAVPDEAEAAAAGGVGQAAVTKKSAWTKEEDAALWEQVRLHGAQNWAAISGALPGRNPKSCRLRWCQHLTPGVDAATPFSEQEDAAIAYYHSLFPNKWATIARYLPARSDNAIKNRWNSVISKHLQKRRAASAALLRLPDGTLLLFPLEAGDVMKFGKGVPVLLHPPPGPGDPVVDLSGACLNLFRLVPGDLYDAGNESDAEMMDVDSGNDDPTIFELRLSPSTSAASMAAFKAIVEAVRAP